MGKGASLGEEAVLADSGRAGEMSDFFSILLCDDVAHKIVQGRIGDFDLDDLPCCG